MLSNFETFKKLHQARSLFVLPNAWDAKSALLFEENNFAAVGTSSAAVSASLGYEDGEGMPFADYFFVIKRILAAVKIPVTIDLEMGFGKSDGDVFDNIRQLAELGVAGINLEDSVISKATRKLGEPVQFAKRIVYINGKLLSANLSVFINIRCDTYLLSVKEKQKETVSRLKIYEDTGADGIFLPGIRQEADIAEAVSNTKLPINVMCIPGLPDIETLNKLGVKRASLGPFFFNSTYKQAGELAQKILSEQNLSSII